MDPTELIAHRRQTAAYIEVDPISVEVRRQSKVSDGAGGFTTTNQTLPPQEVRLFSQASRADVRRTNEAGEFVVADFILIASREADIKRFDRFTLDGGEYQVLFVLPDHSYQLTADVSYRGQTHVD